MKVCKLDSYGKIEACENAKITLYTTQMAKKKGIEFDQLKSAKNIFEAQQKLRKKGHAIQHGEKFLIKGKREYYFTYK